MEDFYQHKKQYCREGESDAQTALAVAMVWCVFTIMAVLMFLWAIGIIRP